MMEPLTNVERKQIAALYAILALACIIYLVFSLPSWVIALGALPGATMFLYKVYQHGDEQWGTYLRTMRNG